MSLNSVNYKKRHKIITMKYIDGKYKIIGYKREEKNKEREEKKVRFDISDNIEKIPKFHKINDNDKQCSSAWYNNYQLYITTWNIGVNVIDSVTIDDINLIIRYDGEHLIVSGKTIVVGESYIDVAGLRVILTDDKRIRVISGKFNN